MLTICRVVFDNVPGYTPGVKHDAQVFVAIVAAKVFGTRSGVAIAGGR